MPYIWQKFLQMLKWFGAIIGYLFFRLPGAVLGFLLGSLAENLGSNKGGSVFSDFNRAQVSPADFELNLLSLCSIVIKADGQVSQQEMDYVREYFLSTYGKEKANAIFRTFNEVIKKREIYQVMEIATDKCEDVSNVIESIIIKYA